MRASLETYEKVAENCSAYEKANVDNVTNSACDCHGKASCTNCKYFDENKYCRLDLYDKIVQEHGL